MLPGHNPLHEFTLSLILALCQLSNAQAKQNGPNIPATIPGRSTFNSICAACHGLDGRGSDKAVNIAAGRARGLSDGQLAGVISDGVPGTGMPAFHALSQAQVRALVGYLRTLQGKGTAGTLSGDAKHGREIFFGKGECSSCHAVAGQGGFLGPDLTDYAATTSAEAMRDEIVKSPRAPAHGYRTAVVTTISGERLEGLIRNEDNFSMQLQSTDGNFHLLRKSDVRSCEPRDSLMPANYRERLSDAELNDLVSFLMKTPNPSTAPKSSKNKDDWE